VTKPSTRFRALVLRHEAASPAGLMSEWLAEQAADVDELRIDLEDRQVDPCDFDLIVSLGSEFPAYDDSRPFVPRESGLLHRAVDADVPVLGLCFGGQLLARVLGGSVFRAPGSEIGWMRVRSRDPELVPEGPWFQWHFDTFTVPPGATLVADSDLGPQAFVAGRSLGLQFHPELTLQIMDDWVRVYRHELDAEGVDPDALLAETERRIEASRRHAWQLLERYLMAIVRVGEESVRRR
jgi:GMP synthase-like glutamine amidotransferase